MNFIKLGKPVNNQYPIYLRYFYTQNQKKFTYNLNCETLLSAEQLEQLKKKELPSSIQLPLLRREKEIQNLIHALYVKYSEYPNKEILKEYFTIKTKEFELEWLIDEFVKSHKYKAKEISLKKYREQLRHIENYVLLNIKHFKTYDDLVNIKTVQYVERYLDSFAFLNKHISNNSFKNIISMTVRFLNFVAKKYSLTEIEYKVKIPLLSEKIHITQSEFTAMINYDVNQSGLRVDHKANLKQTQDIMYVNSFVGLRINELLKTKKGNITFNDAHITIKFLEQKKSDIREVIIVDEKAIEIVKHYSNKSKSEYLFNLYVNVFNNNLKVLAKLSGMTDDVECIKKYRTQEVTISKPKWELISSHAIRRFAVNQNVVNYGIDIARQFSGHKDYATIKKSYMRNINQQELLERLKDSK